MIGWTTMTSETSPASAQRPATNGGRLSLDDISKYFNIPIAEASSILGVCTSVLKRICRENGIVRWPYRKFLAGKSVEDIKKDAARERSKEQPNNAIQNTDVQKMTASVSIGGNLVPNRTPDQHETVKVQQGNSITGNVYQPQGNKILQHGMTTTMPSHQLRNIPTYLDDFKFGFPVNGLATASAKWWGTNSESGKRNSAIKSVTEEEGKQESCESVNETSSRIGSDLQDHNMTDTDTKIEPSTSLLSLRKRAVEHTCESLQVGISNDIAYKLGKRQRLALLQVFRSSLPNQWKDSFL